MAKLKDYLFYQDDWATIYLGDCRDILPMLEPVDLVLTDPPYGIADIWKGGFNVKHGWGKAKDESFLRNEWDSCRPSDELMKMVISKAQHACIWGGNYFQLPISRGWFVWNKPERGFSLGEAELAWTNIDTVIRVFDCNRSEPDRKHPTQKPLDLMIWCIQHLGGDTIEDPFMGSGTTLVAAKNLNRKSIGIEIEEKYCAIAKKRLRQEVFDFRKKESI